MSRGYVVSASSLELIATYRSLYVPYKITSVRIYIYIHVTVHEYATGVVKLSQCCKEGLKWFSLYERLGVHDIYTSLHPQLDFNQECIS